MFMELQIYLALHVRGPKVVCDSIKNWHKLSLSCQNHDQIKIDNLITQPRVLSQTMSCAYQTQWAKEADIDGGSCHNRFQGEL